jgi:hypothetical protein
MKLIHSLRRSKIDRPAPPLSVSQKFDSLLNRLETHARELGWPQVGREEREHRSAVDLAGARAELLLLEQEANGDPYWDETTSAAALEDALRRRALASPCAASQQGEAVPRDLWRWNWRRAVAIACVAVLAGLLATALLGRVVTELCAALGVLTVLLTLGPWVPPNRVIQALGSWDDVIAWKRARRTRLDLEREIRRLENDVLGAAARRAKAELWIDQRLDVVRRRYETERSRAEMASHVARGEQIPEAMQATL